MSVMQSFSGESLVGHSARYGLIPVEGDTFFVSDRGFKDGRPAYTSLLDAVSVAKAGDQIGIYPTRNDDGYDVALTIARAKRNLRLVGLGPRGSVFVAPSAADSTALTIEADDVEIVNIGLDGDGAGHGCVNRGRRTRIFGSKIEGGTDGLHLTMGSNAQIVAGTHGKGDDLWIVDCEIAWNTNGFNLVCTDRGALTQVRFRHCVFHNNTNDGIETVGALGSADIMYRNLDIGLCKFSRLEDGTEPTAYLLLNGHNDNTGEVWGCTFPSALAGGKNLVSTGLIWVSNLHSGGISTGQPS